MDNYEQKYKEILEMAREAFYSPETQHVAKAWLLTMFPALAESEDEKIRKELIGIYSVGAKVNAKTGDILDRDIVAWLEKQGNKSVNIDIEPIISSYKQRLKSQGGIENTPLFDMCLTAFRHGVENVLDELNLKTLDPYKVIEWIDEHVPTKFEDMENYVQQFKKDFGL